jgi:hypothetical protein
VAVYALPDPEHVKEEVWWPFTHFQILNKSKCSQVAVHALPNLETSPEEVRCPFTHCQVLNKSKRRSGGRSLTARS